MKQSLKKKIYTKTCSGFQCENSKKVYKVRHFTTKGRSVLYILYSIHVFLECWALETYPTTPTHPNLPLSLSLCPSPSPSSFYLPFISCDQRPQLMYLTACIHSELPSAGKSGHFPNLLPSYTLQKATEWRLMSWKRSFRYHSALRTANTLYTQSDKGHTGGGFKLILFNKNTWWLQVRVRRLIILWLFQSLAP